MKQNLVQPQVTMEPLAVRHGSQKEVKTDSQWFAQLLQTRPLAFWSGVWVSVFLVAIVAVGSLISPNAAERRSVSAIAVGSDSVVATQPLDKKGQVPFWLFGAIAITCTAGSLLVSRQLNSKTLLPRKARVRRRKVQKPPTLSSPAIAKQPSAKPKRQRRKAVKHPQRLKTYSPSEALFGKPQGQPQVPQRTASTQVNLPGNDPRQLSVPSFTVNRGAPSQRASVNTPGPNKQRSTVEMPSLSNKAQPIAKVPVTVVPEDQVHPLDWNAPRLADAVDLRRRKSIKTWM